MERVGAAMAFRRTFFLSRSQVCGVGCFEARVA
jgi:hypothetical protein